jgi:transcriptional regulator with PAS, ATPase and Fis domain
MGTVIGDRRGHAIARDGADDALVGDSPAFAVARHVAAQVAARQSTILILGETGTGKELMARMIHARSPRAARPFIPVDCSSLAEGLFESELFGHVRGAFTGASRDSLGFIRAADGGTLFLDEIGELAASTQAKLLRVLQERRVVPVGETRGRPVDIRVVAATHRDLGAMVRDGQFRQDLYFRLNVVTLRLPPLRERSEDVLPLARHFLCLQAELYDEPLKRIAPDAGDALRAYDWPGNVREVANVMEQAHVLATGECVELDDLPPHLRQRFVVRELLSDLRLEDVERRTILEALRRTKFCKAAAARLLGLNIQRLNRRIARLGISRF